VSPEQELGNIASWKVIEAFIERLPSHSAGWEPWSTLARKFVSEGKTLGLNRYFRAGTSVTHLVFSTLDHRGLRGEPRVTVEFHPENEIRVAYGTANLHFSSPEVEYSLPFEPAFATFRRFLNQLWTATMPEPVPDDLHGFWAPILTSDNK
jgi:hypothetical protein